eukprot:GHVQ01020504.1.p1 GENE.GHVQ01020504.1~~GHVQ01020504.1.p1  ORF type:complete len:227 (+),score=27.64 GHVQ01020504.1:229-909(+)
MTYNKIWFLYSPTTTSSPDTTALSSRSFQRRYNAHKSLLMKALNGTVLIIIIQSAFCLTPFVKPVCAGNTVPLYDNSINGGEGNNTYYTLIGGKVGGAFEYITALIFGQGPENWDPTAYQTPEELGVGVKSTVLSEEVTTQRTVPREMMDSFDVVYKLMIFVLFFFLFVYILLSLATKCRNRLERSWAKTAVSRPPAKQRISELEHLSTTVDIPCSKIKLSVAGQH